MLSLDTILAIRLYINYPTAGRVLIKIHSFYDYCNSGYMLVTFFYNVLLVINYYYKTKSVLTAVDMLLFIKLVTCN